MVNLSNKLACRTKRVKDMPYQVIHPHIQDTKLLQRYKFTILCLFNPLLTNPPQIALSQ